MSVSLPQKRKKPINEKKAGEFVDRAGAEPKHSQKNQLIMSFRIPGEIVERVDKFRNKRPGNLSRNQAMVELLDVGLHTAKI